MSRIPFLLWHTAILLALLLPPKLFKAERLASDSAWSQMAGLALSDVLFVLAAEALFLGVAAAFERRGGRWIRAAWGLALLPLMLFSVTEHRFFLSSGSFLDWSLFWHGLMHANQLTGLVGAEMNAKWWILLLLPIPTALLSMWLGFTATPRFRLQGRSALGIGMLGLTLLVLVGWWGGEARSDPRLASLKGSIFLALGLGAMNAVKELYLTPEGIDEDFKLPDPIELAETDQTHKDNVVVIVMESVRADATTPYNPQLDTSPFLDKLAREGMKIEHGYTVLPHTTKSLVPILCGTSPDIRQALSETVPGALPQPCLPTLLEPLGYSSAFFQPATGKFEQRKTLVESAGFGTFVPLEKIDKAGWESPNYLGVEDRALVAPMMRWVDDQKGPFFLGMLTLITHHNYKVPSTFPKKDYGGSERWSDYLNTIRYSDGFIQEVFQAFEKRGLLDHTIFVILGDHGECHGEHGRRGHDETVYQEGIHIPYILWSRHLIPTPLDIGGNRLNLDLAPTLVDLLGLRVVKGAFEGTSLLKSVDDRAIYTSCWYEDRCLARLSGDQKIIYHYGHHPTEVFDLAKDPQEKRNLAATVPLEELDRDIAEMKAWKHEKRLLYLTHKRLNGGGNVLFERPGVDVRLDARLGDKLRVIGYDDLETMTPGEPSTLTIFFEVKQNLGWHWKFKLFLEDGDGKTHPMTVTSSEEQNPLYSWIPGQYMRVQFKFTVPKTAPDGDAHLELALVSKGKRMKVSGKHTDGKERTIEIPIEIAE